MPLKSSIASTDLLYIVDEATVPASSKAITFSNVRASSSVALTGDITGSGTTSIATTLPTVNSNVGSFTNANITVNAKGLVTAASTGSGGGASVTRGTFTSGSLTANVLTITHNLGLSAPYSVIVVIFNNSGVQIIPDTVTGSTNSVAVDLTSFATISGTWGYAIVAG